MRVLDRVLAAGSRHRLESAYRLGTPDVHLRPAHRLGRRRGPPSTCGCPISTQAATWRCGCRPTCATTALASPSTSAVVGAGVEHAVLFQRRRPDRRRGDDSCPVPAPTSRRCPPCWSSPRPPDFEIRRRGVSPAGRDEPVPPVDRRPRRGPRRRRRLRRRHRRHGSPTTPFATAPGPTGLHSSPCSGTPGGAWSTTGPPRHRSAPSSTRCSIRGSAGGSSRPGPATVGSMRRGPAGPPPAAGSRSPGSPTDELDPRPAAGPPVPAPSVEPPHPDRVLSGGLEVLRRHCPPRRRPEPAALRHGRLVHGQHRSNWSRPTGCSRHLERWSGVDLGPWFGRYVHGGR